MKIIEPHYGDRHHPFVLDLHPAAEILSLRMTHLGEFEILVLSPREEGNEIPREFAIIETGCPFDDPWYHRATTSAGGRDWHLLELRMPREKS